MMMLKEGRIFCTILEGSILLLFCIALIYASWQDRKYQRVKRSIWYVCCFLGMFLILLCWPFIGEGGGIKLCFRKYYLEILIDVLCFWWLQMHLFAKMYGKADCFAFGCCSLIFAAYGGGMFLYLCHMLISVFLMGIVQVFRKNIGKNGNLKKPVAFIPYISKAFLVCLLVMEYLKCYRM